MASLKYQTNHRQEWRLKWWRVTALVGVIAGVVIAATLYAAFLEHEATQQLDRVNTDLVNKHARLAQVDDELEGLADLSPEQHALIKRISSMGLPRYMSISESLYRLERLVPDEITLLNYSHNRIDGTLQFTALLSASSQLSRLVEALESDRYFKTVRVFRSQERESGGKEVVLKLSLPDSADE